MKIAVLLLAHESADQVARRLGSAFYRSADVKVYLHHDRGSRHHDRAAFEAAIPSHVQWQWLPDAVRARWGEYALVEATLRLMQAALADEGFDAERLLLASGSCRPVRPLASLQAYLRERPGVDFIQAHDIALGRWTKGGLEQERFEYFFPFNYQTQRRWFERATALQRALRVRRRLPAGLRPHFGSQWFCLRRDTAAEVVGMLRRPELARFFASTWIPDEFAIQTVVAALRPASAIAGHGLTYYEFDAQGKPLVLEDWHAAHVLRQPFFFARKISPDAQRLERELDAVVEVPEEDLHYFARVGNPTPDFERFLAAVRGEPARRSRVGGFPVDAGGPMAGSRRRYYVLHGSSRLQVGRLLAHARALLAEHDGPVFDFPFDRSGPALARDRLHWRGFGPGDRRRIAYDPCAALHELVHVDPRQCVAFGLDVAGWSWVRDFIVRDPNAVLVDCDPPGLSRAQRAARLLINTGGAHEAWLRAPTVAALARNRPLPQDFIAGLRARGATRCVFARLADVGFSDDPTWQALTAAAAALADREGPPQEVAQAISAVKE
jgi:hypothetical protein